jgi:hypothetical protein
MGLDGDELSQLIPIPCGVEPMTLEDIMNCRLHELEDTRASLDDLHKKMSIANQKKRDQARKQRSKKYGVEMAQFEVGDYALYMNVWATKRDKLSVTWCGPAIISGVVSDWIFKVTNMVTGDEREVHASRLRFFDASLVDMSTDMKAHVAYNSEGHIIEDFWQVVKDPQTLEWEVLVSWRGLERIEDSWEPVESIIQDVPAHFKRWLEKNIGDDSVRSLCDELDLGFIGSSSDSDDVSVHPMPIHERHKRKKRKTNS